MSSIFGFVVGLLQAALSLLGFVQAHPELPQASRDQAQQVAQQAITQATNALASQQTVQSNGSLRFTATPTTGMAPLSIWFSAALSSGTKDNQSEYSVDFGDGTSQTMEWENGKGTPDAWFLKASHTYASPGTYKARVGSTCTSRSCTKVTWLSSATVTVTSASQSNISVPDMSKYTDTDFGFSFWYPTRFSRAQGSGLALVKFSDSNNDSIIISALPSYSAASFSDYLSKYPILDANSGRPVQFQARTLGSDTFYYRRSELFEGVLSVQYYLLKGGTLYKFDSTSQGVDWTNPNFKEENDPTHVALRQMLTSLTFSN